MRKLLPLLLAGILLLTGCSAKAPETEGERRRADAGTFFQTLEKKHKDLYALVDKATWNAQKETFLQQVDTLDEKVYWRAYQTLAASLGDAHTRAVLGDDAAASSLILPLTLAFFDEGLFVVAASEAYSGLLGQQVTAIGGHDIEEALAALRGYLSFDNEAWLRDQAARALSNADVLSYLGLVADAGAVEVTVADVSGNALTETVAAARLDALPELLSMQRAEIPAAEQAKDAAYALVAPSPGTLIIRYNRCQEDPGLPMDTFVSQAETAIARRPSRVIVDLRYNSGGNSAIFEPMISMLSREKDSKAFSLYVLIGPGTFSSALLNAISLKKAGAVLIGQPTGGSVNHYGELKYVDLEYAPVRLYYSTKFFKSAPEEGIDSLRPDIEIPHSFFDYQEGWDAELGAALAAQ